MEEQHREKRQNDREQCEREKDKEMEGGLREKGRDGKREKTGRITDE